MLSEFVAETSNTEHSALTSATSLGAPKVIIICQHCIIFEIKNLHFIVFQPLHGRRAFWTSCTMHLTMSSFVPRPWWRTPLFRLTRPHSDNGLKRTTSRSSVLFIYVVRYVNISCYFDDNNNLPWSYCNVLFHSYSETNKKLFTI